MSTLTKEILKQLSEPFPLRAHKFKVQSNPRDGQTRALIVVYLDARDVMERLDTVVAGEWGDAYKAAADRGVECALTVCGVTRCDVGDENNSTEPQKSGYSDAFKRAGVKFGVGRYLYDLPKFWAEVKKVNDKFYVLADREEERLYQELERALKGEAPRSNGTATRPAAQPTGEPTDPRPTTPARPRSPLSAVQRRKLVEIYRNLHGGSEAAALQGLDALFVESFKHKLDAASYEEGAHITAQLLTAQRAR